MRLYAMEQHAARRVCMKREMAHIIETGNPGFYLIRRSICEERQECDQCGHASRVSCSISERDSGPARIIGFVCSLTCAEGFIQAYECGG